MKKGAKNLATKSNIITALNLGEENKQKIEKLQRFDLCYFIGGSNYMGDNGWPN